MEPRPAAVPAGAKQAGDVLGRWAWTEPSVWTDRMLTALEKGVKGGVWFSLIDKVYAAGNLVAATMKVVSNGGAAGVDHVDVEAFAQHAETHQKELREQLRRGSYRPQAIRRVYIPKPGSDEQRPLGIPTVRDRVVQTAIVHVLEPIFERDFAAHSYGFRPRRGAQQALERVKTLLAAGYGYVVDADLKSYFDTIPHEQLRGWFGYFKRCHYTVFGTLDGWIRRRLRSLLRKRTGRKGISRHGADEERWPNAYFAEQGLYSLKAAHAKLVSPLLR
jgi:RNA-directed DNA polymerase